MTYAIERDAHPGYLNINIRRGYWRAIYFKLPEWFKKIVRRRFWVWDKEQYLKEIEIERKIWDRRLENYHKKRRIARSLYMDEPQQRTKNMAKDLIDGKDPTDPSIDSIGNCPV